MGRGRSTAAPTPTTASPPTPRPSAAGWPAAATCSSTTTTTARATRCAMPRGSSKPWRPRRCGGAGAPPRSEPPKPCQRDEQPDLEHLAHEVQWADAFRLERLGADRDPDGARDHPDEDDGARERHAHGVHLAAHHDPASPPFDAA